MNKELTTAQEQQLNSYTQQLAQLYKDKIDEVGRVASGDLKNFESYFTLDDEHFRIYFNLQEYWKWVENGRPPGKQPPRSAIEKWIEVKHIVPNPVNNKIPSTKQLAYLIGRKIGKEGYEGKHPLKQSMESAAATTIINEIKQVLINKIKEEFHEILVG